jgi:hypothetical protein
MDPFSTFERHIPLEAAKEEYIKGLGRPGKTYGSLFSPKLIFATQMGISLYNWKGSSIFRLVQLLLIILAYSSRKEVEELTLVNYDDEN